MSEQDLKKQIELLQQLCDNQKIQLERQAEALEIQKQQFEIVKKQMEQAQRIQDRAEKLQDRSAQIISAARKSFIIILPIIFILIVYLSWILFR